MKRDRIFKGGLVLQLLLIPVTFLWHFSPEANYYNWVLAICFSLIATAFFWPQVIVQRVKRLPAIKLQLILVIVLLTLSWAGYIYFYHFTRTNCTPAYPLHNGAGQSGIVTPEMLGKNCYFGPVTKTLAPSTIFYTVNWQLLFGRPWTMLMDPGISPLTGIGSTFVFLALPAINFYRYSLDKKRIQGIKKEELFI